jgi:hypothetical protein
MKLRRTIISFGDIGAKSWKLIQAISCDPSRVYISQNVILALEEIVAIVVRINSSPGLDGVRMAMYSTWTGNAV